MHQNLLNMTGTIEEASDALNYAYSPEQLYALRTGIRRIRSILKHIDSHRSRGYRKTWGGFAAVTNDARDWDVFLVTAEKLLSPGEYGTFEELNAEQIKTSRKTVVEMLDAAPWRRHLEEWRHYLEQSEDETPGPDHVLPSLERALFNARQALRLAMIVNEDRRWHKFRIAVKEVRYVADTGKDHPSASQHLQEVSAACRSVQTLLGDWHDTVVQLGLLSELEAAPIHDRLGSLVQQRNNKYLSKIRKKLSAHPLFL